LRYTTIWKNFLLSIIIVFSTESISFATDNSYAIRASGVVTYSTVVFYKFLFGVGPEEWNTLKSFNQKYQVNMRIATCWINSRNDLYGWWTNSFLPQKLWNIGCIPHIITWSYFSHSWGVDYSAYNLSLHKQDWLDDLAYMAERLKAPDDGRHVVLVSLETEFNCYKNINYTYWNQLMIESRNIIKQIAPNVLVSYCIGGWAWRWGDVSMRGLLAESMRQMDFMSFQCMWGCYGNAQTRWMNGDNLKSNYEGVNWTKIFGDKPHIWDYMIDDIINNCRALSKYNEHVFLAHFCIDHHLWGDQCQVDVLNAILNNVEVLKKLGLFGISWMNYRDTRWDEWAYWPGDIGSQTGGFEYPDGTPKRCLSVWVNLVNSNSS
jgi:hypothetical protein